MTQPTTSEQQVTIPLNLNPAITTERYTVTLDCRRSVYIEETKTLFVSDLHWGKSETFRKSGIPIPNPLFAADLNRLAQLIQHYSPSRVVILGDLIHGKPGLTNRLLETLIAWRQAYPVPMLLIQGNHDKSVMDVAKFWDIEVSTEDVTDGPFLYSHHPRPGSGYFNWCGHVHPTIRLSSPVDSVRLACFHLTDDMGLLPAFSYFTGGCNIERTPGDQVFVAGDDFVLQVHR